MKKTLLLALAIAAFASCTKTKTVTVNVPVHDTTVIYPSLVGTWKSTTGVSPIAFTASTYQIQTYPANPFSTVADTIFDKSLSDIIWQRWIYKVSAHNDTLWLTSINPTIGATDIYTRN